jgi:hypothetical protein
VAVAGDRIRQLAVVGSRGSCGFSQPVRTRGKSRRAVRNFLRALAAVVLARPMGLSHDMFASGLGSRDAIRRLRHAKAAAVDRL